MLPAILLPWFAMAETAAQDDTVQARECLSPPIIDGRADDDCWAKAKWQAIDQVWIPYGDVLDAADFTGRYKVSWSSETDRIYFLVEVTDDVLVKGYKYPAGGYYNWDVVEIFFDEDASGGDHKLNQNAFAYHITAGNDEAGYEVMDLAAGWQTMNYTDHLDCVIEENNGVYTWEIAMIVYNEDYDPGRQSNPTEELYAGKISGLSIAYCDNDDPDEEPKTRDNFIGSVEVPAENFNDHWINADWFGTLKLVAADYETGVDRSPAPINDHVLLQNYPNPFNPQTTIVYRLADEAEVLLTVYDALGRAVKILDAGRKAAGRRRALWNGVDEAGRAVNSGVYFLQLDAVSTSGALRLSRKIVLLR